MVTSNIFKSDLNKIYGLVQSSMITYPKELVITLLRDYFSHDTYYHYTKDVWGFPNTVDHTDLPLGSGMNDNLTTRLFIGENYRYDGIFYPAIFVKNNGARYVPISINREAGSYEMEYRIYEDGYGNTTYIPNPKNFLFKGVWEGTLSIDIYARDMRARDDLAELVGMFFADVGFDYLYRAGLIVKPPQIGSPSESDDRNDKLYRLTITLEVRSEWVRKIPIDNILNSIMFSIEFANLSAQNPVVAQNLTINTEISLLDTILNV